MQRLVDRPLGLAMAFSAYIRTSPVSREVHLRSAMASLSSADPADSQTTAVAATTADIDPASAMPASDAGDPGPEQTQTDGEAAPPPAPTPRPSRVRAVSPRALSEIKNGHELVWGVLCALLGPSLPDLPLTLILTHACAGHKGIYEQADGELHGDINPNSIVLLDHPGAARPWDQPARTAGAMIYWEPPISIQTARKMGEVRDRPCPPPQTRERTLPPYAFGYRWYH